MNMQGETSPAKDINVCEEKRAYSTVMSDEQVIFMMK